VYNVDRDHVLELGDVLPMDPGAPIPMVLAQEHRVFVAYYALAASPDARAKWNGLPISDLQDEPVIIADFSACYAQMFGPPNDEAFAGHPLHSRGLRPYRVFEVLESSWIRSLERMNSVHPHHDPARFAARKHFVLAFHDSTFECVADRLSFRLHRGTPLSAIASCVAQLGDLS
jgi:hypothetical protein